MIVKMGFYELIAFIGSLHGVPVSRREYEGVVEQLYWYPSRGKDGDGEELCNQIVVDWSGETVVLLFDWADHRRTKKDYALLGFAMARKITVSKFDEEKLEKK